MAAPAPVARKKSATPRATAFQPAHALQFCLEITQREADLNGKMIVTSVACLFCKRLGRMSSGDNDARKRKRTNNVKYFSPPFRKDNMMKHVREQHGEEFAEYTELNIDQKKSFFDGKKRRQQSLLQFMSPAQNELIFNISKGIGEMFFKPELDEDNEEMELIMKVNALKLFHVQPDGSYESKIRNPVLYNLVLQHMSVGLAFRQTAAVIGQHKDAFGNGKLGGLNDLEVGKMVRVNVAANLQAIANVLNDDEVWAFSLAGDGSTHQGVPFFDVRIRICVRGLVYNLHLVVVPFFDRHSAKNICLMICKLLDQLCASWRSKLISVSTDGENTMKGWRGGFVTLMAMEAVNDILRVWCAPHQMDLVIRDATVQISGNAFAKSTHAFTVHLRQQSNLQLEMGSKCPKDTNRWAHFQGQLQWLLTHRVRLMQWIEARQRSSAPSEAYWVIAAATNPLAKVCNVTLAALQARDMVLSQQTAEIKQLVQSLILQVDVQRKDDNSEMRRDDREEGTFCEDGPWWISLAAVLVHVKDQGTPIKLLYESLSDVEQMDVLRQIGGYALRLVKGLSLVQAKRDRRNNASAELAPPVFPQQLYKLRTSEFIDKFLDPRRDMMIAAWGEERVDRVEQEHRALLEVVRSSAPLKIIDQHDHKTMFNDAWDALPSQPTLNHLRSFCGGLATAFANTTMVESDFSILKCEKDAYRTSLSALSLEGVFLTKQLCTIREILDLMA